MALPPEIMGVVIRHLENDRNALCNLCLVSTSFLSEAQRVLYRDINVAGGKDALVNSGWLISFPRAAELLNTLIKRNRALATHVRRLYHHNYYYNQYYWGLIKQSLQLMTNLKSLIFTSVDLRVLGLFDDCTFRLEVFGCDWSCRDNELRHDMTRLLSSQLNLTSLYIWGFWHSNESFPEAHNFPNLGALAGDRRTIESILPGQSMVTQLTWIPSEDEDCSTPPLMITTELSRIRILALGGDYERPDIRFFLPYLPSLQILRLYGDSPNLSPADDCALAVDFPNLRILIWTAGFAASVQWHRFTDMMDKHNQYALAKALFSKTTVLEKVYIHTPEAKLGIIPSAHPGFDSQYYICWERNKPEPSVVGFQDAIAAHGVVSWYP